MDTGILTSVQRNFSKKSSVNGETLKGVAASQSISQIVTCFWYACGVGSCTLIVDDRHRNRQKSHTL
ncbi:hypothetical protein RCL_jg6548.t1 [Rhizophagus clarus]|uniref:Uncharacterized protein n=1 Tax=Rhizophagus clarus TaxID=94130 RepID=A0A8H3QQQ0_9GLOM|nr:hypothetical protein RCL_jg6548.t1 [Rhizophagus clarus]